MPGLNTLFHNGGQLFYHLPVTAVFNYSRSSDKVEILFGCQFLHRCTRRILHTHSFLESYQKVFLPRAFYRGINRIKVLLAAIDPLDHHDALQRDTMNFLRWAGVDYVLNAHMPPLAYGSSLVNSGPH